MPSGPKDPPRPPGSPWDDEPTVVWSTLPDWVEREEEETATLGTDGIEALAAEQAVAAQQGAAGEATKTDATPIDRGRPSEHTVESQPRADVEVEIRKMSLEAARRMPRVYEIWTKNRVYSLDASLICIEVIDLATGQPKPDHPFVGARLAGGQRQTDKHHEMSFPLPAPGSDAVFQKEDRRNRIRLSLTSPVTRVILHVQRAQVALERRDQAWGRITATEPRN